MRIGVITDSHFGHPGNEAFSMHPVWPHCTEALIRLIRVWVQQERISLLLHAGDVVHSGLQEAISAVTALDSLGIPVKIALGNHDLMDGSDGLAHWIRLTEASDNLAVGDRFESHESFDLVVMNNRWKGGSDLREAWNPTTTPLGSFSSEQITFLSEAAAKHPDRHLIVATHFPTFLPLDLVDPKHELSSQVEEYQVTLAECLRSRTRPVLVVAGHCHVTQRRSFQNVTLLTTGALNELPCMTRTLEVSHDSISVSSSNLLSLGDVYGHPDARHFEL